MLDKYLEIVESQFKNSVWKPLIGEDWALGSQHNSQDHLKYGQLQTSARSGTQSLDVYLYCRTMKDIFLGGGWIISAVPFCLCPSTYSKQICHIFTHWHLKSFAITQKGCWEMLLYYSLCYKLCVFMCLPICIRYMLLFSRAGNDNFSQYTWKCDRFLLIISV